MSWCFILYSVAWNDLYPTWFSNGLGSFQTHPSIIHTADVKTHGFQIKWQVRSPIILHHHPGNPRRRSYNARMKVRSVVNFSPHGTSILYHMCSACHYIIQCGVRRHSRLGMGDRVSCSTVSRPRTLLDEFIMHMSPAIPATHLEPLPNPLRAICWNPVTAWLS